MWQVLEIIIEDIAEDAAAGFNRRMRKQGETPAFSLFFIYQIAINQVKEINI